MVSPPKKPTEIGEIRQDITTNDWVVIATGRAKRPHDFIAERPHPRKLKKYLNDCPFCNLSKFPQRPDVLRLPDSDAWQVHIFGNLYPAFTPRSEFRTWKVGPYRALDAVGYHEILALRWHNQEDHVLTLKEHAVLLEALQLRYRQLRVERSVSYIQIIKNHGLEAGGSLEHPHHQIFTVPILPNDITKMLHGAETYFREHKQEVFQVIQQFEYESGDRIVWENDHFLAFCPYASRVPFETWILPKRPNPFFEDMNPTERAALAEAMQQVFHRLAYGLNDPPYNYYIHSAPCDDTGFVCDRSTFQHFRWHIEVLPRLSKFGGFELGTGLEINTALPEESAKFLREVEVKL